MNIHSSIYSTTQTFIENINNIINQNKKTIDTTERLIEKIKNNDEFNLSDYESNILNAEGNERSLISNCFPLQLKTQLMNTIEEHNNVCKEARDKQKELKLLSNQSKFSYGLEAIARAKSKEMLSDQKIKHMSLNKRRVKMGLPPQEFIEPQLTPYQEFALNLPNTKKDITEKIGTTGGKQSIRKTKKRTLKRKNKTKTTYTDRKEK